MTETVIKEIDDHGLSAFTNKDNFETALRVGNMLSKSDLVPQQYQNNVSNCVIALEMANRMGASVFAVMQNMAIIHGKPSFQAKFTIGAINSCGRFSPLRFVLSEPGEEEQVEGFYYQWDPQTKKSKKVKITEKIKNRTCYAWATDRRGENLIGPEASIRMAVEEGWYSKSDSKWKTLPELMLQYRAASFWGSLYAPDLTMGMQTAEEVRDIYDAEPVANGNENAHEVKTETSRTASVREKLKSKARTEQPHEPDDSNPQLVEAILNAVSDSKTEDELVEAEDLIREVKIFEEMKRCSEAVEKKREELSQVQ